jgi:acyl carrier protein
MWDEKFEGLVREYLPFLAADDKLGPGLALREFGLDSLGVVDLLVAVESAYGVRLTDDVLSMETFTTPAALWGVLSGLRNAPV